MRQVEVGGLSFELFDPERDDQDDAPALFVHPVGPECVIKGRRGEEGEEWDLLSD